MGANTARYDRVSVALHWGTAVLVAGLWLLAQVIDLFPPGAGRVGARSAHIVLGLALAGLIVLRLLWRWLFAAPIAPVDPGLLGRIAAYGHLLLYAALFAVLVTGVANAWIRGDSLFGLFSFPAPAAGNRTLRHLAGEVHEVAANAILILAGLHAVAALAHHFILRDETLRRMLPQRWAPDRPA